MTIFVLLPLFDDAASLPTVLEGIHASLTAANLHYRVVVVDDGSADGTDELLVELGRRYPLDVVVHKFHRRLGETVRDGLEHIAERCSPDDVILRMSADGAHDPERIPDLIAKLDEGSEVAIASRYAPGGGEIGLDRRRRSIARATNILFKAVFPIGGVRDYTCAYRAYRAAVMQDALAIFGNKFIDLKGLGFTATLEKLLKLRSMGARITEIPFVMRYRPAYRQAKVLTSSTTLGCLILLIKHVRFWSLEGRIWKRRIAERADRLRALAVAHPSASRGAAERAGAPSVADVRDFWESNPLFAGESRHDPGSKAFFEEHEEVTRYELARSVIPFALRGIRPGMRVLDVGCGIGFWMDEFSEIGADVTACDLTNRAAHLSARRVRMFDLAADVVVADAEALPFRARSFDHLNCQGVIHHTPDTQGCIEEFHRVLGRGGTLCFSVYFSQWFLRSKLAFRVVMRAGRRLMGLTGRGREGMLTADTPEELVRLYDGAHNPLGKSYQKRELRTMLDGRFRIERTLLYGVPRRSFRFPVPSWVHSLLDRGFGLMIALQCRRLEVPEGLTAPIVAKARDHVGSGASVPSVPGQGKGNDPAAPA